MLLISYKQSPWKCLGAVCSGGCGQVSLEHRLLHAPFHTLASFPPSICVAMQWLPGASFLHLVMCKAWGPMVRSQFNQLHFAMSFLAVFREASYLASCIKLSLLSLYCWGTLRSLQAPGYNLDLFLRNSREKRDGLHSFQLQVLTFPHWNGSGFLALVLP